jgi:hypothetical protein
MDHEICDDRADNNGDALRDCADPECAGGASCVIITDCAAQGFCFSAETVCTEAESGTCNGSADKMCLEMLSSGCFCWLGWEPAVNDACTDTWDNDCDGTINDGCAGGIEICDNAIDDDNDGRISCSDPDCWAMPPIAPCMWDPGMGENCYDGIDNSDPPDGLADCADPFCQQYYAGCP